MSRRILLSLALIVAVPRFAPAQFTTFIPPPRPPERVSTRRSERSLRRRRRLSLRDTIGRIRLTDMRIWVDSAVGIRSTARPPARPDSVDASRDYLATSEEVTSVRRFTAAARASDPWPYRSASLAGRRRPSFR